MRTSDVNTRWFEYDRDKLWLVSTQIVPVIFEPPCTSRILCTFSALSVLLLLLPCIQLPRNIICISPISFTTSQTVLRDRMQSSYCRLQFAVTTLNTALCCCWQLLESGRRLARNKVVAISTLRPPTPTDSLPPTSTVSHVTTLMTESHSVFQTLAYLNDLTQVSARENYTELTSLFKSAVSRGPCFRSMYFS
jgi:hypothetical protein